MTSNAPPLRLLRIELLRGCPLTCVHCSAEAGPGRREAMRLEQVIGLLSDARELGADRVIFTGGEPLEFLELEECLGFARKLGLDATLFTTGISRRSGTPGVDRAFLAAIQPLTNSFVLSLYSHRPEVHDRVTANRGSWSQTMEAALHLAQLGSSVHFTFLPLTQNYSDLMEVARLARTVGAVELRIIKLVAQGRAARNSQLTTPAPAAVALSIAEAKRVAYPTRIRVGGAAALYGFDTACEAPVGELFVGVDGWISPCPAHSPAEADPDSNCFNVGLQRVWEHSRILREVRRAQANGFRCADSCVARSALTPHPDKSPSNSLLRGAAFSTRSPQWHDS